MSSISRRALLKSSLASAAACALPASASSADSLSSLPAGGESAAAPIVLPTSTIRLDENWRFHLGNADLPEHDFNFAAFAREGLYAKNGGISPVAGTRFDDSSWTPVTLPHDWAVELPFVEGPYLAEHGAKPLGREYPETSIGWYRKVFTVPKDAADQRFMLRFDGIFRNALLLLNGMYLGETWSGYAPYTFDITDMLNLDGPNALAIRVDATLSEGWFYEGAGIYRHVWLTRKNQIHLVEDSTIVRTVVEKDSATLTFLCDVMNQSSDPQTVQLKVSAFHSVGGAPASQVTSSATRILPGKTLTLTATARLASPRLWSPADPQLYTAAFTLTSGSTTLDQEETRFGIRTFHFDPDHGFFVNGTSVKIKGTCNHHDHAGVGVALPDALHLYRLNRLKQMGSNAVRTSHNPPSTEFLDACDSLGMLAMVETRLMSSSEQGLDQLSRMIRRFRNHPSVFIWSLGNEEREQGSIHGQRMVASMRTLAAQLDPTRLVTVAMNGQWGKGVSHSIDVQGCNYYMSEIDPFHKEHPQQPMIGTETASALSTRGEYFNDTPRGYMAAYDTNKPRWGATAEEWWKFYDARPFLAGGFAWTGFDYRGEPTPYGYPCISSHFGIMDTCGFPKDTWFYYKSWWGDEPSLHLFPHWDWPGRTGEPIEVWVHSNLDEVELFLNGSSLGSKKVERLGHVQWSVPYTHGVLEARGSRAGKVLLTERRESTSKPTQLRLSADRSNLKANGDDLAILTVEVLDEKSRLVPIASNLIHFEVAGAGHILGVGNGDPSSHEPDKATQRSAFNGLCMAILQTQRDSPGAITLTARSANLQDATLTLHST